MDPIDIRFIIATLTQLIGILVGMDTDKANHARESAPFHIQTRVDELLFLAQDPGVGFFGLSDAIAAVRLDTAEPHLATLTDVLDAIALLTPVTLPDLPPEGWNLGGGSDVWLSNLETFDWCAVD